MRRIKLVIAAGLLVVVPACDEPPVPDEVRPLASTLERVATDLVTHGGSPGVQIAVVHGGALAWTKGFGYADARRETNVTRETLFRVWSLSMPATAWGIMTLVEADKLDLDRPVDEYLKRWHLPASRFDRKGVTARTLLAHKAGIAPGPIRPSAESLLASLEGVRFVAPPGETTALSEHGYSILQLLIEDVTGRWFAEYMRAEVLRPLGMTSADFAIPAETLRDRGATGHDRAGAAERSETPPYDRIVDHAALGLTATAGDIARLVAAELPGPKDELPGRAIISPLRVSEMVPSAGPDDRPPLGDSSGLGHQIRHPEDGGPPIVTHGGASTGWQASFQYSPSARSGIVVLTNGDAGMHVVPRIECEWRRWAFKGSPHCGQFDIYTMRPDGTGVVRLTHHAALDSFPAWSPDGRRIAFNSDRTSTHAGGLDFEIFAMNADGSEVVQLTESPGINSLAVWSPDGRRMAFVSSRDGDEEIYVMHADGSAQVRLTHRRGQDFLPAWSPDGRRIVWSQSDIEGGTHDLWIMNADGSGQRRLTTTPDADETSSSWSPDGASIAFENQSDFGAWVMNADGSFRRRVSAAGTSDRFPRWSPDGKAIVFTREGALPGEADLFAMKPDGSRTTQLAAVPGTDTNATWSPQSDRIGFASDR